MFASLALMLCALVFQPVQVIPTQAVEGTQVQSVAALPMGGYVMIHPTTGAPVGTVKLGSMVWSAPGTGLFGDFVYSGTPGCRSLMWMGFEIAVAKHDGDYNYTSITFPSLGITYGLIPE